MLWLLHKAQLETHQSASNRQFQVSQTDGIFSADCIRFAFAIMKAKTNNFLEHKLVCIPWPITSETNKIRKVAIKLIILSMDGNVSLLNSEWIHPRNNFGVVALTYYRLLTFSAQLPKYFGSFSSPKNCINFSFPHAPEPLTISPDVVSFHFIYLFCLNSPKNFCMLFTLLYVNVGSYPYIDFHIPKIVFLYFFTCLICF